MHVAPLPASGGTLLIVGLAFLLSEYTDSAMLAAGLCLVAGAGYLLAGLRSKAGRKGASS